MKKRLLKVTLNFPDGSTQILDQGLMLRCRIKKAALAVQNKATVEVGGLTDYLREYLLSNFTAFNKRLRDQGQLEANYVNVTIEAGYQEGNTKQLNLVYKGQVVTCELTSPPPNMTVRFTCYTQQINRTKFITTPAPSRPTFKEFVEWAGQQMGLSTVICDTSINNQTLVNPGRTTYVAQALLIEIQNYQRNTIAAYIDDDTLIVKDKDKILNSQQISTINEFVGVPTWNEWGADFTTMYSADLKLAQGVKFKSLLNPSLNDTTFVIMQLEYDLASRDDIFTVTGGVAPSA